MAAGASHRRHDPRAHADVAAVPSRRARRGGNPVPPRHGHAGVRHAGGPRPALRRARRRRPHRRGERRRRAAVAAVRLLRRRPVHLHAGWWPLEPRHRTAPRSRRGRTPGGDGDGTPSRVVARALVAPTRRRRRANPPRAAGDARRVRRRAATRGVAAAALPGRPSAVRSTTQAAVACGPSPIGPSSSSRAHRASTSRCSPRPTTRRCG